MEGLDRDYGGDGDGGGSERSSSLTFGGEALSGNPVRGLRARKFDAMAKSEPGSDNSQSTSAQPQASQEMNHDYLLVRACATVQGALVSGFRLCRTLQP